MKRNVWGTPKGWTDIGSDISWDEYGGRWARKGAGRTYYVIDFTNMYEACGREAEEDGASKYVCEVRLIDLDDIDAKSIKSALDSCSLTIDGDEIVDCTGSVLAKRGEDRFDLVLAEACNGYGAYAPIDSAEGMSHPVNVRGKARRIAEIYMRDERAREVAMDRPVNRIGSTAREYMRGDIDSALNRGPFDMGKNIMRKIHGMAPIVE